jgi:tyrosine-protein phosphatase YwqE
MEILTRFSDRELVTINLSRYVLFHYSIFYLKREITVFFYPE